MLWIMENQQSSCGNQDIVNMALPLSQEEQLCVLLGFSFAEKLDPFSVWLFVLAEPQNVFVLGPLL